MEGEWHSYAPDGREVLVRRRGELWLVRCGQSQAHSKNLGSAEFHPLYKEAEALDTPIAIHAFGGDEPGSDIFDQFIAIHTTGHPFPVLRQLTAMVYGGIPELFPKLRIGFIEASAQWVPWVVHEAKNRFKALGRKWPERGISEYRMFITCENSDDISYIVDQAGEDCLVIGTDYGHTDTSSDLDAIKTFKARSDIAPEIKQKILSDNARALYGL